MVGAIFIAISTGDTVVIPEGLTHAFEVLVGVFMLFLGAFGMVRACRKRPSGDDGNSNVQVDELPFTGIFTVDSTGNAERGEASMSVADVGQTASVPSSDSTSEPIEVEQSSTTSSRQGGLLKAKCSRCIASLPIKMLACLIGIIHGVAGPGGVLGVIPAVQLKDWKYSTIYLGSFCISSTLCMGCFATLYGTISRKLGKDRGKRGEFIMECISASLSIIVGILWLTLLACGKLDAVFP